MTDNAMHDLASGLAEVQTRLDRIEQRLERMDKRLLSADHVDHLSATTEILRQELEVARRSDAPARLQAVDESLRGEVTNLRRLSNDWSEIFEPIHKEGGLTDLLVSSTRRAEVRLAWLLVVVAGLFLLAALIVR